MSARLTGFERYIEARLRGEEPEDDYPKSESTWEELFDFGRKRVEEIIALRRRLAQYEPEPPKDETGG